MKEQKTNKEDILNVSDKKILLIEPPFYNLFGYDRWYYPLTLTLVGTYLEEKGNKVEVYDADRPTPDCRSLSRTEVRNNYYLYAESIKNDNNRIWKGIKEKINNFMPDFIGLTSISAKIDSANKIAQMAKDIGGNKVITVLGGPHAQGMMQHYPNYDFGEYYDQIITFIPGLINRKPNKSLLTNRDKYRPNDLSMIITLSGCPYSCTFCCNSGKNKKLYYRDIDTIREEMHEIKEINSGSVICIADDCLFSNSKRFRKIGELLKEQGMKFTANSIINALSKQKLDDFIEYGGIEIQLGIESGSQRILDLVQKKQKIENVIERTKWLNDAGLRWKAFFITGFPFESLDEIKMTEELAYKIEPTFISLNRFTPYPGTQIWEKYFVNLNLTFEDLFQLNKGSVVYLDREREEYIEKVYRDFDAYNDKKEKT